MSKRFLGASLLLISTLLGPGYAAVPDPDRVPIQAELVKDIEAGRVKVGDPVLVRVEIEWKSATCALRKGAILQGRVVSEEVRSKASKTSALGLLFESGECGGRDLRPLSLTIAAIIAPDPNLNASLYRGQENQPLSEAIGQPIGGGGSAGAGFGFAGSGNLRSVTGAAGTSYVEPIRYKPPKAVLPGQVVGIGGVKLSVGSGPEGSSVLSSAGRNLRLELGSQFVLVPNLKASPAGSATEAPPPEPSPVASAALMGGAARLAAPAPPLSPLDETDICAPPQCSLALPASEARLGATTVSATVSVQDLGYALRGDRAIAGFDYDSALAYLGSKALLFTFDPHALVRRTGAEISPAMRTVRAVLINLESMKVAASTEWPVLDGGQYLWPIGNDRVLAHVGHELRMYGPGLRLEQRVSLDGPLAFLRTSPSGKYVAVGALQERHSRAIHEQLLEAEGREPEEDVEVKVLSADFRTLLAVTRSSRDAPPVLSDEGEIRIPEIARGRWRIVENSWDGQRRVIAQVTSSCRPEATSLLPNLLFLVGCDRQADGRWYRVLRPDGKPVLKGWSPSAELEQTANGTGATFAVGVARAVKSIAPEAPFHATDLESENIEVYRVENGQRRFAVSIPSPVPTLQTFVLSPGGDQLAVLRADVIALYKVPGGESSPKPAP